jgi:hypothetical protein
MSSAPPVPPTGVVLLASKKPFGGNIGAAARSTTFRPKLSIQPAIGAAAKPLPSPHVPATSPPTTAAGGATPAALMEQLTLHAFPPPSAPKDVPLPVGPAIIDAPASAPIVTAAPVLAPAPAQSSRAPSAPTGATLGPHPAARIAVPEAELLRFRFALKKRIGYFIRERESMEDIMKKTFEQVNASSTRDLADKKLSVRTQNLLFHYYSLLWDLKKNIILQRIQHFFNTSRRLQTFKHPDQLAHFYDEQVEHMRSVTTNERLRLRSIWEYQLNTCDPLYGPQLASVLQQSEKCFEAMCTTQVKHWEQFRTLFLQSDKRETRDFRQQAVELNKTMEARLSQLQHEFDELKNAALEFTRKDSSEANVFAVLDSLDADMDKSLIARSQSMADDLRRECIAELHVIALHRVDQAATFDSSAPPPSAAATTRVTITEADWQVWQVIHPEYDCKRGIEHFPLTTSFNAASSSRAGPPTSIFSPAELDQMSRPLPPPLTSEQLEAAISAPIAPPACLTRPAPPRLTLDATLVPATTNPPRRSGTSSAAASTLHATSTTGGSGRRPYNRKKPLGTSSSSTVAVPGQSGSAGQGAAIVGPEQALVPMEDTAPPASVSTTAAPDPSAMDFSALFRDAAATASALLSRK